MFWGNPLRIPESFSVRVSNLANARQWHVEKLGFREGPKDIPDDSGSPFVAVQLREGEFITLVEISKPAEKVYGDVAPIFFASNLAKAQRWLSDRGVATEPIEEDSGGNPLFYFQDLEGNRLEVCKEP